MDRILKINTIEDIPKALKGSPIYDLICYHNFNAPHKTYEKAEMMIAMCMDNRKRIIMPENFSYILRSGGVNLNNMEYKLSFAIAIGDIRHIALIAHNHCGMVGLKKKEEQFVEGMINNAGWKRDYAQAYFEQFSALFHIDNEIDFILEETERFRIKYPLTSIIPLYYTLEDNKLNIIKNTF